MRSNRPDDAPLHAAIARFGREVATKLRGVAASGAPEDQLRAPVEQLVRDLAELVGLPHGTVTLVGESALAELGTRPDFAVVVNNALVGFVEVKSPGKGADPRRFADPHDRVQWEKLRSLPNLLYTDGNEFGLWRDGQLQGQIVRLDGDVATSGARLRATPALPALLGDFLRWSPIPPRSPRELAEITARLCRLLREEVLEELRRGRRGLTDLATDWRRVLFPEATDAQFADGYAQAVTFGLLAARAREIDLAGGIHRAAEQLRRTNSLIGAALGLLTDDEDTRKALSTALDTLVRVLDAVSWAALAKGDPDAWLYFYEDFLAVYDNRLRRQTGSYYTPPGVVSAMVRLVDEALRDPDLFALPAGLAASTVTVVDPAMGTGTFLLGVLARIAETVRADQGPGAVPGALAAAAERLFGFELQLGPFAVAQLRLMGELSELCGGAPPPQLRLYVTDTLADPFVEADTLPGIYRPIGESRRQANRIKREVPITVVIGNPPYKVDAAGRGGWIERNSSGRPSPIQFWLPPAEWNLGVHSKHLHNLYVYFWRWATWKVFAADWSETTGLPGQDRHGAICFITAAGFLNGPGFQKMRLELRRDCTAIWVIDCSPEGHQPKVRTRLFEGVQQPVCIVLAVRAPDKDRERPARVLWCALPAGPREGKLEALSKLDLSSEDWQEVDRAWRAPFLPRSGGNWETFVGLPELFLWSTPGVKSHRTWIIAPDPGSLTKRWLLLTSESDPNRKEELFHSDRDRDTRKITNVDLGNFKTPKTPVASAKGPPVPPIRYGYRSFDRQYIIPDHRLISQARPDLWATLSDRSLYMTALDAHSPRSGPAITFTELIPDNHHYKGSFAGRVFPLWRDAGASEPNVKPTLLRWLAERFGRAIEPLDVMAYLAAVMAHPAFTARFRSDLVRPGLRVPLSADPALFAEAAALGRQVIWLHTYGERCVDPNAGRPHGPPRLPADERPTIPADAAIPGPPEPLPDTLDYDPVRRCLLVGGGRIERIPPEVWAYEVSGKNVLRQWFSYRKRDRSRPLIGDRRPPSPLDKIQPDHWLASYTEDLIDLVNVLGLLVRLEPRQADLLERICAGPLIDRETLVAAGALASPQGARRRASRGDGQETLGFGGASALASTDDPADYRGPKTKGRPEGRPPRRSSRVAQARSR